MMTHAKKMQKTTLVGLLPVFALAVLAGFAIISCDPGDPPDPATGPDSSYSPLVDDPQPGITLRVNPGTLTVPDPTTLGEGRASVLATYRDPAGNPEEGLQMNFTADSPNISFQPSRVMTDRNGTASGEVIVAVGTPSGSYALVAFTSPASGGPNERGQTILKVVENPAGSVTRPNTPSGPSSVDQGTTASFNTGGSSCSLVGEDVEYAFFQGQTQVGPWSPVPTSVDILFNQAIGSTVSMSARARCDTTTSIVSSFSDPLLVTVTDPGP